MNKQEDERRIFDMSKQDIRFLHHAELVKHDDRPDFILKDKDGRKIGLEHFRADVYQVQDKNSSHISGGHTILSNSMSKIYQEYHPFAINNSWTDEISKNAIKDVCKLCKDSLNMRSNYKYEAFIDNLRVGVHGRQPKPKGHIEKSRNYPDRKSYDLMGFLIEVPVPSFEYHFETIDSRQISRAKSLLCPLNIQGLNKIPRRYNHSYQRIKGIPITNEIWNLINIFDDIDFVIIETYIRTNPQEHYGQYFDKTVSKPHIFPAFSFGLTELKDVTIE